MSSDIHYEYRTGIGTDIHRLVPDRKLMLGGVHVPCPLGLLGHSDGDVVLHGVIDAILGASGMGDIGMFFPDSDDAWKDADSSELMSQIKELIEDSRWEVVNVDVIVHAEEPKLEAFKGQMKRSISGLLGIDFVNVNIKAKTNEGFDAVGTSQAIAATAMVLLRRRIKRTL